MPTRLALLLLLPAMALAGPPTPATQHEVAYLMGYLKESGCEFNRNGTWYGAAAAVEHLDQKYQYLLKKDQVASTEDFIAKAATESSMTGKPYQVRCPAKPVEPSAVWLRRALAAYRLKAK